MTLEIQEEIGYVFRQLSLLDEALTHKSHLQGKKGFEQKDNERLEFLGDAVLALVVSEYVATAYPTSREGELSKIKAHLVSRVSLASAARRLNLGSWLRLGRGEEISQGRDKNSLLANALEAMIAAIYLDGGLEPARSFVLRALTSDLEILHNQEVEPLGGDYKSRLQEWSHKHYDTFPQYKTVQETGPDHEKAFEVIVLINEQVLGRGRGRSKKEAEQMAAMLALQKENSLT